MAQAIGLLTAAVSSSPSPSPVTLPGAPTGSLNLLPILLAGLVVVLLILILAVRLGGRRKQSPADPDLDQRIAPPAPPVADTGTNPPEREIYRPQPTPFASPAPAEAPGAPGLAVSQSPPHPEAPAATPGPPPQPIYEAPPEPVATSAAPPPPPPPPFQPILPTPSATPQPQAEAPATPPVYEPQAESPAASPIYGPPPEPLAPIERTTRAAPMYEPPVEPTAPAPTSEAAVDAPAYPAVVAPGADAGEPETSAPEPPAAAAEPEPALPAPLPEPPALPSAADVSGRYYVAPEPLSPALPPTRVPLPEAASGAPGPPPVAPAPPAPAPPVPEAPVGPTVEPVADVPAAVASAEAAGAGSLILLIEDDERIAKFYTILFEAKGYAVQNARDGVEGVDMATSLNPALILLDVMMPKMNGLMVLQTLRANPETERTPVVVLSNYMEPPLIQRALQLGAIEYVVKSQARPEQLVSAVPSWLQGEPALH